MFVGWCKSTDDGQNYVFGSLALIKVFLRNIESNLHPKSIQKQASNKTNHHHKASG
jgi:hypothetical protein